VTRPYRFFLYSARHYRRLAFGIATVAAPRSLCVREGSSARAPTSRSLETFVHKHISSNTPFDKLIYVSMYLIRSLPATGDAAKAAAYRSHGRSLTNVLSGQLPPPFGARTA
jgi:hypothetical protein